MAEAVTKLHNDYVTFDSTLRWERRLFSAHWCWQIFLCVAYRSSLGQSKKDSATWPAYFGQGGCDKARRWLCHAQLQTWQSARIFLRADPVHHSESTFFVPSANRIILRSSSLLPCYLSHLRLQKNKGWVKKCCIRVAHTRSAYALRGFWSPHHKILYSFEVFTGLDGPRFCNHGQHRLRARDMAHARFKPKKSY